MKKKNEDEKNEDFFCCTKNVDFHEIKTSNLADSKYVIRLFISIMIGKLQPFKVGLFCHFWGTLKDHSF